MRLVDSSIRRRCRNYKTQHPMQSKSSSHRTRPLRFPMDLLSSPSQTEHVEIPTTPTSSIPRTPQYRNLILGEMERALANFQNAGLRLADRTNDLAERCNRRDGGMDEHGRAVWQQCYDALTEPFIYTDVAALRARASTSYEYLDEQPVTSDSLINDAFIFTSLTSSSSSSPSPPLPRTPPAHDIPDNIRIKKEESPSPLLKGLVLYPDSDNARITSRAEVEDVPWMPHAVESTSGTSQRLPRRSILLTAPQLWPPRDRLEAERRFPRAATEPAAVPLAQEASAPTPAGWNPRSSSVDTPSSHALRSPLALIAERKSLKRARNTEQGDGDDERHRPGSKNKFELPLVRPHTRSIRMMQSRAISTPFCGLPPFKDLVYDTPRPSSSSLPNGDAESDIPWIPVSRPNKGRASLKRGRNAVEDSGEDADTECRRTNKRIRLETKSNEMHKGSSSYGSRRNTTREGSVLLPTTDPRLRQSSSRPSQPVTLRVLRRDSFGDIPRLGSRVEDVIDKPPTRRSERLKTKKGKGSP
ncbi:hypothetical protein BDN70DRAFT_276090 [Pholiota conissans]|uniref:Uncharacterized protein n=1 Tax=Pholiota conissans TaxID=109636 RepID=A0A9P5Z9X9_9AGAR|nr:hypothetical protein BDN70DRAFT_276090 [Pholiota conissans]